MEIFGGIIVGFTIVSVVAPIVVAVILVMFYRGN
jgi:hypothetical protein